jgi:hypothetical protein
LKNHNLKKNSSSGASSNQLLGSERNKRVYSSQSSKRPSNRKTQTMNMVQDTEIIDEEEILVMSRTGDKDAFSRTAKKSSQKDNMILPVRTSYNNGVVIIENK